MKATTYYIDESGNTGDAIKLGEKFNFGGQPMFTLAAIGIADTSTCEAQVSNLKRRHRIQARELKSDIAWKKPAFARELFAYLTRLRAPLFVEVVDKRYYVCANIVSTWIAPPIGDFDLTERAHIFRQTMADYLQLSAPPCSRGNL
jgi:hypothetical protein